MSFERQIKQWSDKTKRNAEGVFRQSVQETVNDVMTIRPKGGRLPFKTGFLRATAGAGINEAPRGPTKRQGAAVSGRLTGMGLTEGLARWKPGDTFYWAFSAIYARAMEARYAFVRGATDKWDDTVNRVARTARNR